MPSWPSAHGTPSQSGESDGDGPVSLTPSWSLAITSRDPWPAAPFPGLTPLFDGRDHVFAYDIAPPGTVVCMRVADGVVVWRVLVGASSNPVEPGGFVMDELNNILVLSTTDGELHAFDAATGATLWIAKGVGGGALPSVVNAPAVYDSRVVVLLDDGTAQCYNVTDATKLWSAPVGSSPDAVQLSRVAVSFGSMRSTCGIDERDSPCDIIFVAVSQGVFKTPVALALDAATGAQLWVHNLTLEELPTTELVVGGGRVFFGTGTGITSLSAMNGSLLWAHTPSGRNALGVIAGAPVIAPDLGLVLVCELYSGVFALYESTGRNKWFSPFTFSNEGGALDAQGNFFSINIDGGLGRFDASNGTLYDLSIIAAAQGSSSPALDGKGALALFTSPTAMLVVVGPPPPPLPPAAGLSKALLSEAAAAGMGVLLTLLVGVAILLCVMQRQRKRLTSVVPRTQRSAATSMIAFGDDARYDALLRAEPLLGEGAVPNAPPLQLFTEPSFEIATGGEEGRGSQPFMAVRRVSAALLDGDSWVLTGAHDGGGDQRAQTSSELSVNGS